jgi:hypothetical protein
VQHYLKEPSPEFDDSFVLDTITCRVREEDIVRISPEIPFFMHHYEIFRNQEWSREHWLQELLAGMEPVPGSLLVEQILQYSRNLALTDGQLYPDSTICSQLPNIVQEMDMHSNFWNGLPRIPVQIRTQTAGSAPVMITT